MRPITEFWKGKSVLVTGGTGFIGSVVVEMLVGAGANVRVTTRKAANGNKFLKPVLDHIGLVVADLSDPQHAKHAVSKQQIVLHLAAEVGGIEYNINHPASIFRSNLLVFLNTLEAARAEAVERFLVTSSACVYPRFCQIPTPEEEGFKDRPEPTNEGYGWAKRMEEFLGEAYHKEYGMAIAIARPYNCYGPRDNFDPKSSHVIPALIRRIWKDQERPLHVWGSGRQSRSFLYVEDFAQGLLEVAEKYPYAEALNIGNEEESTISEVVGLLNDIHEEMTGQQFEVVYDTNHPEGQPRRRCDTRKALEKIGYEATWPLKEGLRKTVEWYIAAGMP